MEPWARTCAVPEPSPSPEGPLEFSVSPRAGVMPRGLGNHSTLSIGDRSAGRRGRMPTPRPITALRAHLSTWPCPAVRTRGRNYQFNLIPLILPRVVLTHQPAMLSPDP